VKGAPPASAADRPGPAAERRAPAAELLIGREPELKALAAFLERPGAGALVLAGEAGIGKTTLWQAGLDLAARQGLPVLSTRASEGEAGMLFAAVADLVDGIDADALGRVPEPQMRALDVALRRAEPGDDPPEPFAVSSGLLSAIRGLSERASPVIAVDDATWLDPASADSLLFAARRMAPSAARFLLSRRSGDPSPLERALEPLGVRMIEVGPLSLGATSRLLSARYGLVLPRRVLHRVHEAAQGNPLFALELGRAIRDRGAPAVDADLPLPRLVDEAFEARVSSLAPALREALLTVTLSPALHRDVLSGIVDPLVVEDALDSGLLGLDRNRVRAGHPMLAAAARRQSTAAERRGLHLRLAQVVDDPVVNARHLARATPNYEETVAAAVSAAAELALTRGAVHEAEELAGHALRLTAPGTPQEVDRLLALADRQLNAGDLAGTTALLDGRIADIPPGRPRALAHLMLGEAADGVREETELDLALAQSKDDPDVRGLALCRKAVLFAAFRVERLVEAEELARQAVSVTAGTPEDGRGRVALGWALTLRGKPCEDLIEADPPTPLGRTVYDGMIERPIGIRKAFRGQVAEAETWIQRLVSMAEERGDPRSVAGGTIQLCEFALRRGDVAQAEDLVAEVEQWGAMEEVRLVFARLKAVIGAVRGRPAEARGWAELVEQESSVPYRAAWDWLEAKRARGLAALVDDDFPGAVADLWPIWEHCRNEGVDDPGAFPVAGDLAEALVGCDDLHRAGEVATHLARLTDEQAHPWGRATTIRVEAMIELCAAGAGTGRGGPMLTDAAGRYAALGLEFESARCLLHLGCVQRRARRRTDARQALEDAATTLDRLGCDGWAAKARSELARVSGRRGADEGELTPTEQRVVDLAARGLSNKEIAKVLYVSVYTVEAHLSHAYAKLGIRSRSQLAPRLGPG